MSIRRYTQTTFTQGEVGDFIRGRAELGIYRAGLATCENFLILPQGGIDRRRGFNYQFKLRHFNFGRRKYKCCNWFISYKRITLSSLVKDKNMYLLLNQKIHR